MDRSGLRRDSHSGKTLRNILETLPRDELFQSGEDELFATASGIMQSAGPRAFAPVRAARQVRAFLLVPRVHSARSLHIRCARAHRESAQARVPWRAPRFGDPARRIGACAPASDHPSETRRQARLRRRRSRDARSATSCATGTTNCATSCVQKHGEEKGGKLASRFGKALPAGLHRRSHAACRRSRRRKRGEPEGRRRHPHFAVPVAREGQRPALQGVSLWRADHLVRSAADAREHGAEDPLRASVRDASRRFDDRDPGFRGADACARDPFRHRPDQGHVRRAASSASGADRPRTTASTS